MMDEFAIESETEAGHDRQRQEVAQMKAAGIEWSTSRRHDAREKRNRAIDTGPVPLRMA